MKIKLMISLSTLLISATVYAECPDSLKTEKMVECITVEGSGANYQEWQKNEYLHNIEPGTETASTVSPITGTDVRTLQPAAGTNTK